MLPQVFPVLRLWLIIKIAQQFSQGVMRAANNQTAHQVRMFALYVSSGCIILFGIFKEFQVVSSATCLYGQINHYNCQFAILGKFKRFNFPNFLWSIQPMGPLVLLVPSPLLNHEYRTSSQTQSPIPCGTFLLYRGNFRDSLCQVKLPIFKSIEKNNSEGPGSYQGGAGGSNF